MKKLFAANWKLHKTPAETRDFLRAFLPQTKTVAAEIVIFPPASSWEAAAQSFAGSANCFWGGQNVWSQAQGAFTGENSAQVLKELGGRYALVGHSERRSVFHEEPTWMSDKVAFVQGLGLTPILCIGETLAERDAGQTDAVNARQLEEGLAKAKTSQPLVVAYEPVWAIGTGRVAQPSQVAEAHAFIRRNLQEKGFEGTPILYGGSVKPENAGELLGLPDVNGFLVGGASLDPESFLKICRA
ncbi:MAG: triose-phosphate isomerase [Bdellovibrionaceae bacterium]|nr:triose-phosphate isomerase [Pseudobdellovibrionaceae bacterium]